MDVFPAVTRQCNRNDKQTKTWPPNSHDGAASDNALRSQQALPHPTPHTPLTLLVPQLICSRNKTYIRSTKIIVRKGTSLSSPRNFTCANSVDERTPPPLPACSRAFEFHKKLLRSNNTNNQTEHSKTCTTTCKNDTGLTKQIITISTTSLLPPRGGFSSACVSYKPLSSGTLSSCCSVNASDSSSCRASFSINPFMIRGDSTGVRAADSDPCSSEGRHTERSSSCENQVQGSSLC